MKFRLIIHRFDIIVLIQAKSQDLIKTLIRKMIYEIMESVRIAVSMFKVTPSMNTMKELTLMFFFLSVRQI